MPKNKVTTNRGSHRSHRYEIVFTYATSESDQYLVGGDIAVDNKPVFPMSTAGYVTSGETEQRIEADVRRYIDFLEDGPPEA